MPNQAVNRHLNLQFPRIFALLIGINDYAPSSSHVSLCGAEPDARRWKYFLEKIGGPQSEIVLLLGHSATHQAIVKAFNDLAHNTSIRLGDPIVVFYGGHGGQIPYKASSGEQYMIQMIVPSDYNTGNGNGIYCISDLEIGALIDNIAENKGDNITVIMDCCHSASSTRGGNDNGTRVRSIDLPDGAYNPERYTNGHSLNKMNVKDGRYWRSGIRSHVLLAACKSTEKAHEHRGGGFFSTALLELFHSAPLAELRYCNILPHLKHISTQTPQCEGFNKHRFLFRSNSDSMCEHGAKNGIACSGESGSGVARSTDGLRLFIPTDDRFRAIFTKIRLEYDEKYQMQKITLVDRGKEAHIQALMNSTNAVTFKMLDSRITKYGFDNFPSDWSLDTHDLANVAYVLSRIANYYQELNSTHSINPNIANDITLEFYQLDDYNESDWRKFRPKGLNLYHRGVVDFEVDEGAPYGLKLANRSARDLYPYVFFFNSIDFSIASLYETSCSSDYTVESPLKSKSFLTFGYGSGGVPPHAYKLDGDDINVDFMKIVLTTRPMNTAAVAQPSPFQSCRAPTSYIPRFLDSERDTILIPFIQRKPRGTH